MYQHTPAKLLPVASVESFWAELEQIGDPNSFLGSSVLEKSAETAQAEHNATSIKNMMPGDIIVASPGPPSERATAGSRFQDWLFTKASPYWQGRFTHAGIYVGDGKTVEAYPQGIIKRNASELLKNRSYVVIRPKVSEETRLAAAEFAESQLGKSYSKADLIRAASRTLVPSQVATLIGGSPNISGEKHVTGYQCGGLVAASYAAAGSPLSKVNPRYVPPVELITNTKAQVIGKKLRKGHELNAPVVGWLKDPWSKKIEKRERKSSLSKVAAERGRQQALHNISSIKDMERGDIIVASSEPLDPNSGIGKKLIGWTFQRASPYWQGLFTHAGIYVGDGKTVEAYAHPGVFKRDAAELLKGRSYVVIRPKVSKEQREAAADFAESHVGQSYDFKDLTVTALRVVLPSSAADLVGGSKNIPDVKHKVGYQCGGLVAAAYASAGAPLLEVNPKFVPPAELLSSPKSDLVGLKLRKEHKLQEPIQNWLREEWLKKVQKFKDRAKKTVKMLPDQIAEV